MEVRKHDIQNILKNYNLGNLVRLGPIEKDDTVSFGQIIETSKGKFFLKLLRKFNNGIKQGFETADALKKKGFPTYKIYKTKNKELFLSFNRQKVVILEFIPKLKFDWKIFNINEIRSFSKTLAQFHKLTKNMRLEKVEGGDYNAIKEGINKTYRKRKRFSKDIQNVLEFMKQEIDKIPKPKNRYKTGFFSEFNPGHVKFKNEKVSCVLDWEIGKEEAFYDIGSSLTACFTKDGKAFSWKKFGEFVKSYSKERRLTQWERENMFNALKFGILKYGVWEFFDLKTGGIAKKETDIDKTGLNRVYWLMEQSPKIEIKQGKDMPDKLFKFIRDKRKKEYGNWDQRFQKRDHKNTIFFFVKDGKQIVGLGALRPIAIEHKGQGYDIYGIAGIMSIEKGKGYGKILIREMINYLKKNNKTGVGFCGGDIEKFYKKAGLKTKKDLHKIFFMKNPKTGELIGDKDPSGYGIYYEGKDNLISKMLNSKEPAYYWLPRIGDPHW